MTHNAYPHTESAHNDPPPAATTERPQSHSAHRGHHLHMLLMCIPIVALGLWSLSRGGGVGTLIVGLVCMAIMFFMHRRPGSGHRH